MDTFERLKSVAKTLRKSVRQFQNRGKIKLEPLRLLPRKALDQLSQEQELRPKFILIDNAILDFGGHFYEYDQAVLSEISPDKYDRIAFGNVDFDRSMSLGFYIPYFRTNFSGRCTHSSRPQEEETASEDVLDSNLIIESRRNLSDADLILKSLYKQDLISLLQKYEVNNRDIIFFPNANLIELTAITEILSNHVHSKLPNIKILLRRSIHEDLTGKQKTAFRELFESLNSKPKFPRIEFFTDTEPLKKEYESISRFNFRVTPVPFRHGLIQAKSTKMLSSRKKRIIYLGGARVEKGFHLIPDAVEQLQEEIAEGGVEFILHACSSSEPEIINAIERLKAFKKGVTLIEHQLSDQEYYEFLSNAHILINTYDPQRYQARSSCIFVESMVSATPIVVTEKSWMASVMPRGVGETISNASELGPTLKKMLANYEDYSGKIQQEALAWKKIHNVQEFNRVLMSHLSSNVST